MAAIEEQEDNMQSMFEEPDTFRPPPPKPTSTTVEREGKDHLKINLIGHHSLWAHCLWNASVVLGRFIDEGLVNVKGATILELGAGAGVPSIISALNGADNIVTTDYPDDLIIDNIRSNVDANVPADLAAKVHVRGFLWGKDPSPLLELNGGRKFDLLFLSDLVFNHSQHHNLLKTCRDCLAPGGTVYCIFSHHRPWFEKQDMALMELAQEAPYSFTVTHHSYTTMPVMFENDPGSVEVRSTVKCYTFK